MFAIVATYRANVGEDDAIIALHEHWEHSAPGLKGYPSWQLFRNIEAPRDFIAVAQFENEELARAAILDLKRDGWYDRLISLTWGKTDPIDYMMVWQLQEYIPHCKV
jgi:hypothetical protein